MNALTLNSEQTMSSLDLLNLVNAARTQADETQVRRNDFHARCRDELDGEHYETFVVDNGNATQSQAMRLTRDQCMYVLMRESKVVRRAVNEKLKEMSEPQKLAINLDDPAFLRTTLLQYTEKVIELQTTIAEQAPAVEFAHAVRNTEDAISIGDMARLLGTGQNRLFRRLRDDHILMPACTRPYQHFIDRGYFRVIENVWFDAAKEAHPTFKTLVTGRGQVYLQRKYATEVAA